MPDIMLTPQQQGELRRYIAELKRILAQTQNGFPADFGSVPGIVGEVCTRNVTMDATLREDLTDAVATLETISADAAAGLPVSTLRDRVSGKVCL